MAIFSEFFSNSGPKKNCNIQQSIFFGKTTSPNGENSPQKKEFLYTIIWIALDCHLRRCMSSISDILDLHEH